ncbi:MAG: hypothetical protein L0G81_15005, partial [Ewingella sp.]|nr:hypothetical protein [Ewingella sp.]
VISSPSSAFPPPLDFFFLYIPIICFCLLATHQLDATDPATGLADKCCLAKVISACVLRKAK